MTASIFQKLAVLCPQDITTRTNLRVDDDREPLTAGQRHDVSISSSALSERSYLKAKAPERLRRSSLE